MARSKVSRTVVWGRAVNDNGRTVLRHSKCGNYTIETFWCSWGGSRGDNVFTVRRSDGSVVLGPKGQRSVYSLEKAKAWAQTDFVNVFQHSELSYA